MLGNLGKLGHCLFCKASDINPVCPASNTQALCESNFIKTVTLNSKHLLEQHAQISTLELACIFTTSC